MKVKADRQCASVAAASVLAKVARDQHMIELASHHPVYGWEGNKGYGAPAHLEALRRFGPSTQHRQSWSLPGREGPDVRS
jgi:ribonuclease HII